MSLIFLIAFSFFSLLGYCLVTKLCQTLCDPLASLLCPQDSPGKNTELGCHILLKGIFLIQG